MNAKAIEELRTGHFTTGGVDYEVAAWYSKSDTAFVVVVNLAGDKYYGKASGYNHDRTLAAIKEAIKAMKLAGVTCDVSGEEVFNSLVRVF